MHWINICTCMPLYTNTSTHTDLQAYQYSSSALHAYNFNPFCSQEHIARHGYVSTQMWTFIHQYLCTRIHVPYGETARTDTLHLHCIFSFPFPPPTFSTNKFLVQAANWSARQQMIFWDKGSDLPKQPLRAMSVQRIQQLIWIPSRDKNYRAFFCLS